MNFNGTMKEKTSQNTNYSIMFAVETRAKTLAGIDKAMIAQTGKTLAETLGCEENEVEKFQGLWFDICDDGILVYTN